MNSLKATCTLLLLAEMAGVRVGAIAGVTEEVAVPGVETAEEVGMLGVMVAVVDHPVGGLEGPEKTGFLSRLTQISTYTVWERISIQLLR